MQHLMKIGIVFPEIASILSAMRRIIQGASGNCPNATSWAAFHHTSATPSFHRVHSIVGVLAS